LYAKAYYNSIKGRKPEKHNPLDLRVFSLELLVSDIGQSLGQAHLTEIRLPRCPGRYPIMSKVPLVIGRNLHTSAKKMGKK
jgi:hypothetical protein